MRASAQRNAVLQGRSGGTPRRPRIRNEARATTRTMNGAMRFTPFLPSPKQPGLTPRAGETKHDAAGAISVFGSVASPAAPGVKAGAPRDRQSLDRVVRGESLG